MTKKHFIAIAKILRKHEADTKLIRDIMLMCEEQNPRFDRETFIKACML